MVFKIFLNILIVLFVAVAGVLLISSFSIPGVPLDARVVLTGSMAPAIPTGSVVFVVPSDTYIEGDIITFSREASSLETPITHRVMRVFEADGEVGYVTQGDANELEDIAPVRHSEVLGKVAWHVPYLGYLLNAAKTPIGFAVLIIIPALLVIGDEIRKIWKNVRARKETTETV